MKSLHVSHRIEVNQKARYHDHGQGGPAATADK